ncbi:MAG: Rossmann-like domain-containing protein [Velocimicrobium sp.]
MTDKELFLLLKKEFIRILENEKMLEDEVEVSMKTLTPYEAIGITKRKDFPIVSGKEVMLQAEYRGAYGQAFTDSPAVFNGTMKEICALNLLEDMHARGLFVATLNAVMNYLNKADRCVHCKNDGPELCARKVVDEIKKQYGEPKIALVGYQPAMLEELAKYFELRVLDLNQANIGQMRYGVLIEDGEEQYNQAIAWADLILCTGSTLCNGTIIKYMQLEKEVLFFGTTLSGAAPILHLRRICFADD